MSNGGWFAVSRSIFEHYVVGAGQPVKPRDPTRGAYSKMEAWLWLVANAAYEPKLVMNKGRETELQTGELVGAYSFLAQTWNWTPETVRWFLRTLETAAMITRWAHQERNKRNNNQAQTISISNYSEYQINRDTEPQANPKRTPSEPQANPRRTPRI